MKVLKSNIKYLKFIPFLILGLTPVLWFWGKGDVVINGVDTNFPLNPEVWLQRRFFVWNSVTNAGVDFSSSTAGLFFHLIQFIPYKLGFDLQKVQIISLVFWFLATVISSSILARALFLRNYIIQLLFVVFYCFNIYLFNTWENVKVANLALVSAIPIALTALIYLKNKKITYQNASVYFLISAIFVSGAGINPAYFATFFLVLAIYIAAEIIGDFSFKEFKSRVKDFLFAFILICGINAFWILPTVNYIFTNIDPSGSIDKAGFTNWINSLSQNTSILNIARLQGAWDWYAFDSTSGLPLYIPYALNYFYRMPFLAFSFLLPFLVLISLIFRSSRKRGLYLGFALMFTIGIFLGAGTYLPTGHLFRAISNLLPFFTLFRSPWYIFTILVVLAYSGLIGLLFQNLFRRAERSKVYIWKIYLFTTIIILGIGNLIYSYPLVTGKIFRPGRPDTFFVKFPDYVFDSAKWLNTQGSGRVLGYPDDEIEKFTWKYRGIESILQLAADRELLFSPLNTPDGGVSKLIKSVYKYLRRGELESAKAIAAKLNIEVIFEKNDQESLSAKLPDLAKTEKLAQFDNWSFFRFPQSQLPKIYSPNIAYYGYPSGNYHQLLTALEKDSVLLNSEDSVVSEIPWAEGSIGSIILTDNSQTQEFSGFLNTDSNLRNRLLKRDLTRVNYNFTVYSTGEYSPYLERYGLETFGMTGGQIEANVNGVPTTLQVIKQNDSYLRLSPLALTEGGHTISFTIYNPNLIKGGNFEGDNNNQYERGGYGEGIGDYKISEDNEGKYLSILNLNKADVSADFRVVPFDPMSNYYVQLKYKQIYGNNASIIILQGNENTLVKAQTERLPNHPEWNIFSFYFQPVETTSYMKILLSSPFVSDPLGTKIYYDDLEAYKVFSNDLLLVKDGTPESLPKPTVNFTKASPVEYSGTFSKANRGHIITFSENYSQGWNFSINKKGTDPKISHFSSNLYANSWFIEGAPETYEFNIYYTPQKYFNVGAVISTGTLLAIIYFLRFSFLSVLRRKNG